MNHRPGFVELRRGEWTQVNTDWGKTGGSTDRGFAAEFGGAKALHTPGGMTWNAKLEARSQKSEFGRAGWCLPNRGRWPALI